jgi:hypothetical protein
MEALKELTSRGYIVHAAHGRQLGERSAQSHYQHLDGSFYKVARNLNAQGHAASIKSWFYRGLGGNAKSGYDDAAESLVRHLKANKKDKPKTKITRRTSEQVRRDNFVLYD